MTMKALVFLVYVLIAFLFIIAIALGVLVFQEYLKFVDQGQPESSNELREWIAATSGWFAGLIAIAAAVIGVDAISLQISKSSEQHIEAMRFQARDRIVLAQKVQSGASLAHGNVSQLKGELFNSDRDLTKEELSYYIDIARFAVSYIKNDELSDNVYEFLGRRPPIGSYEGVFERWLDIARALLETPDAQLADLNLRETLQRQSGLLEVLEIDLEYVEGEARDFIKRWAHLSA